MQLDTHIFKIFPVTFKEWHQYNAFQIDNSKSFYSKATGIWFMVKFELEFLNASSLLVVSAKSLQTWQKWEMGREGKTFSFSSC